MAIRKPGGRVTLCLWVTMQPSGAHGHATAKRDHATRCTCRFRLTLPPVPGKISAWLEE